LFDLHPICVPLLLISDVNGDAHQSPPQTTSKRSTRGV
jgi:hypothetical protein